MSPHIMGSAGGNCGFLLRVKESGLEVLNFRLYHGPLRTHFLLCCIALLGSNLQNHVLTHALLRLPPCCPF